MKALYTIFFLPNTPNDSNHWGILNLEHIAQDSKGTCIMNVVKIDIMCLVKNSLCNMSTLPTGNWNIPPPFRVAAEEWAKPPR